MPPKQDPNRINRTPQRRRPRTETDRLQAIVARLEARDDGSVQPIERPTVPGQPQGGGPSRIQDPVFPDIADYLPQVNNQVRMAGEGSQARSSVEQPPVPARTQLVPASNTMVNESSTAESGSDPEQPKCTFCQDLIGDDDNTYIHQDFCRNVFHASCVKDALDRGDGRCPLCRETLGETLTFDERRNRFHRFFERPQRQQQYLPGYKAQKEFYDEVCRLLEEYDGNVWELQNALGKRKQNLKQAEELKLEDLDRKQVREFDLHDIKSDKRRLQGLERDAESASKLEQRLAVEKRAFQERIRQENENEYAVAQEETLELIEHQTELLQHNVEMAWETLAEERSNDPRAAEWEEIPYPI